MKIDDLYPWNWFKDEHVESKAVMVPVKPSAAHVEPVVDYGDSFAHVRSDIDRLMGNMYSNFTGAVFPVPVNQGSLANAFTRPLADIAGDSNSYEIKLDVPGFTKDNISIELTGECLTITGKMTSESSQEDGKHFYHVERRSNTFQRMLTLPADCAKDQIEAELEHGVLIITIPRSGVTPEGAQKIEIKS